MASRLCPLAKRAVPNRRYSHLTTSAVTVTTPKSLSTATTAANPSFTSSSRPLDATNDDIYACRLTPEYYRRYRDPSSRDGAKYRPNRHSYLLNQGQATSTPPQGLMQDLENAWTNSSSTTSNTAATTTSRLDLDSTPVARKSAVLFPGSGSQYVGMTSFLLDNFKTAREVWEEAEDSLAHFENWRKDLKLHELPDLKQLYLQEWPTWQKERHESELRQIVLSGPQNELTRSSNAQPAILISSIALLRVLEKEFGVHVSSSASYFAGHSSGEYSACVASNAITFAEGVNLTRLHGLLTSRTLQLSSLKSYSEYDATDEERAQMSAVVVQDGHSHEDVKREVRKIREKYQGQGNSGMCEIASYNSSQQIILSGSRAGVLKACELLQDKGIASRAADLPVFAPFHCSFMSPASIGMTHAWEHGVTARAPSKPIISNLDAGVITTPAQLKEAIVASIHKPVCWSQAMDYMRTEGGVERFIYIGPGKALANLAKKELKSGKWAVQSSTTSSSSSNSPSSSEAEGGLEIASVATLKDFRDVSELCLGTTITGRPALTPKEARALA